jgi:hypothetical protein|tara:strand:+ start:4708 stop:5232 length:525 start_codon:yes stop_codon:yes gene_type:complete
MTKKKVVVHNLRQMSLSNGDEIVCDVIQWNDEENDEIVIKNAMKLMCYEKNAGEKYFSFRPYLIYQEGEEDMVILLSHHVVSIAVPVEALLVQYRIAKDDMHTSHDERLMGNTSPEMGLDELMTQTAESIQKMRASTEDLEEYLLELDSFNSIGGDSDRGSGDVIDMFTKKTIH